MTHRTLPRHTGWIKDDWISRRVFVVIAILATAVIAVSLCWRSVFVVDETQTAMVLSFGRTSSEPIVEAGLHFKRPWQTVHTFDRRLQLLVLEPRQIGTGDHEPVVVQPYACWRIAPKATARFLQSALDRKRAETALADVIWNALDREFAKRTLTDWINTDSKNTSSDRLAQTQIMDDLALACRQELLRQFGIELLDVRLYRLMRPEWMKADIYRRMIADRQHAADQMRQSCTKQVQQMKSAARQEADALIAEAKTQASTIRMQAKTEVQRLLNKAEQMEPELMALSEKLESLRSLLNSNATLVLSGDPDIFGGLGTPPPVPLEIPSTRPATSR